MTQAVRGLDIGTMNLVSAMTGETAADITIRKVRNTFLDVDVNSFTKNMLKQQKVQYAETNGKIYVLGESAFELANIMNKSIGRPMQQGVICPGNPEAMPIAGLLIEAVLGKPEGENPLCYFSIPADPVDADFNIVYHTGVLEGILKSQGYEPTAINEGHAVMFSELADNDFTGISLSCGGGMMNVCVSYKTIPAISFSTSRAGDWVDKNVAQVLGIKSNRAAGIKEKGVNIKDPKTREEEAIVIYYRNLISYTLGHIKAKFESADDMPDFPDPVPIVCSGGSALIGGFADVFKEELEKMDFPIPIKEVRMAEEPLNATAKGCLLAALSACED